MKRRLTNTTFFDGYTTTGESDTTVLLDYTGAGAWNKAQGKEATQINNALNHWVSVAINNRKVAEDALADAERYRRVREFLQRGDGLLDTRGMDDAGFDRMIDSLKECGK